MAREQVVAFFSEDPAALHAATNLWLQKAASAIAGTGPIVQLQRPDGSSPLGDNDHDFWFQPMTWALVLYADAVGIYAPRIAELQVELPVTDGQRLVDGDLVHDYVGESDTQSLRRLYKLAAVEIMRIRAASPSFLPWRREKVGADSENEERDKFLYEERCKNPRPSCGALRTQVNANPDWNPIDSDPGIRSAADRYAEKHKLPPVPRQS